MTDPLPEIGIRNRRGDVWPDLFWGAARFAEQANHRVRSYVAQTMPLAPLAFWELPASVPVTIRASAWLELC